MLHCVDSAGSISDLAAIVTEYALPVAQRASIAGDSVAIEVQLWRSLANQLQREFRLHGRIRRWESPDLSGTLHQIVHRAVLAVAQEASPEHDPRDLEAVVRPLVADLRFSDDERRQFERLFPRREPLTTQRLGRSGIVRRLQFAALN